MNGRAFRSAASMEGVAELERMLDCSIEATEKCEDSESAWIHL